jgi:hypothetical protein
MARRIRDENLVTRAARSRLRGRGKPYYRAVEQGLHLGYRKARGRRGKPAGAGKWVIRSYVGKQSYTVETIGVADDLSDADGVAILSFWQAQDLARERMVARIRTVHGVLGAFTVKDAVASYIEFLETNRKTAADARYHADAHINSMLGDLEIAALTHEELRRWLADLARTPARLRTKAGEEQQYRPLDNDDTEAVRRRQLTANRVLGTLRGALNYAFHDGKVASDSIWRRLRPFRGVSAARPQSLSTDQCKRLILLSQGTESQGRG